MTNSPLIMVVEDETILLQTIAMRLQAEGIETISCTTSDQCLDYLNAVTKLPDALWLDYYLQGTQNALKLLNTLKNDPKLAQIPAIIVSNSASPEKVSSMIALGARHYIVKADYKLSEIIDFFRAFIESERAT